MTYNPDHGYDSDIAKEYIKRWVETQKYNSSIRKMVDENPEKYHKNVKDAENYKSKSVSPDHIRSYNLSRDKIINGLVQVFDGISEILKIDTQIVVEPDFMNLCAIKAFCKSHAVDNIGHWSKAEREYQESRNVDLPGSISRKSKSEKVVRDEECENVWYSLQFMYRQLEFSKYVPNYDIVAGMWNLVANNDRSVVSVIDHWYYIHNTHIHKKVNLNEIYRGYFWRYNAKMTSEAQAETLYILNNLYRHNGFKPLGTLESCPWYPDSVINPNGDDSIAVNIVPHNVDYEKMRVLENSPIVGKSVDGVKTIPSESENPKDFVDKKLQNVVKSPKSRKDLLKKVSFSEKPRDGKKGYFKGKDGTHDQHWDQDDDKSIDDGVESEEYDEYTIKTGSIFVKNGIIAKLVDINGDKCKRLVTKSGKEYIVGKEYK